jgi:tetratricopeptide (TPR) repeat protein
MILCQKCGAINHVNNEGCQKCGTKLMIVSRLDEQNGMLPMWEEHLLERISALENSLGRMDDRLSEIHDLVQQLATENFYDHTMIESIADALKRVRIVGKSELEHDWQRKVTRRLLESEDKERFEASKKGFLNAFRGRDRAMFAKLLEESSQLFTRRNYRRGLQTLERAFSVDPQNCEVGIFLSKIYYEVENFTGAGKCLRRVLKTNPHHFEANLLTGLLAKRKGDLTRARKFLSNAVDICQTSLSAHVFLGSVLVTLGEDSLALGHFSRALDLKPSPQLYLLVGSIYSQQGKPRYAIKHLQKAIEIDPSCDEAFFQLGLAFWVKNWKKKARECFQKAIRLNPKEFRYKSALDQFLRSAKRPSSQLESIRFQSNEEGLEILLKSELRLNFLSPELELISVEEGADNKPL